MNKARHASSISPYKHACLLSNTYKSDAQKHLLDSTRLYYTGLELTHYIAFQYQNHTTRHDDTTTVLAPYLYLCLELATLLRQVNGFRGWCFVGCHGGTPLVRMSLVSAMETLLFETTLWFFNFRRSRRRQT
jgi:hypothetical protein